MSTTARFYEPSDGVHTVRLFIALLLAFIATVLLGYVYNLIIYFMPLIYVNFLVVIGYGIGLGFLTRILIRFSHCRSRKSQIILSVAVAVMAFYVAWAAYFITMVNEGIPGFGMYLRSLTWTLLPQDLFPFIGELNRVGSWQVGGVPFNGILLTLVWLFELAILIALPILQVYRMSPSPYSENQQVWYPKYSLNEDFGNMASPHQFMKRLEEDPAAAVEELGIGDAWRCTKVHLYYLPEEQQQYLSVDKHLVEGRGQGKTSIIEAVTNLAIDRSTAERLLNQFAHQRERVAVI